MYTIRLLKLQCCDIPARQLSYAKQLLFVAVSVCLFVLARTEKNYRPEVDVTVEMCYGEQDSSLVTSDFDL